MVKSEASKIIRFNDKVLEKEDFRQTVQSHKACKNKDLFKICSEIKTRNSRVILENLKNL